jgi:hypothetical protein
VPSQRPLGLSSREAEQLNGEREINSGFPFVAPLLIDQGSADKWFKGPAPGSPYQRCQRVHTKRDREPPKTAFRSSVVGGNSVIGVAGSIVASSVCVFLTFDPSSLIGFRPFMTGSRTLLLFRYRHALDVMLVELIAVGFEGEVIAPFADKLRVVNPLGHRVPLFVVRHRVPTAVLIAVG